MKPIFIGLVSGLSLFCEAQTAHCGFDSLRSGARFYISGTTIATSFSQIQNRPKTVNQGFIYRPTIVSVGFESSERRIGVNYTYQNSGFGFNSDVSPMWASLPVSQHQLEIRYIFFQRSLFTKRGLFHIGAGFSGGIIPRSEQIERSTFVLYSIADTLNASSMTIVDYQALNNLTLSMVLEPVFSFKLYRGFFLRLSLKYSQGLFRTAKTHVQLVNIPSNQSYSFEQTFRNSYFGAFIGLSYTPAFNQGNTAK